MKNSFKNQYPLMMYAFSGILAVFLIMNTFSLQKSSAASFESVQAGLESMISADIYPKQSVQKVRRYFSLDPGNYEDIAFYRVDDALSANEMVLVKTDSEDAMDSFVEAMKQRIDSQISIYEGYAPQQNAMMQNALLLRAGNYALYYTGEDTAGVEAAFWALLEGE